MSETTHADLEAHPPRPVSLPVRAACVLAVGLCTFVAGVHVTRTLTPG